MTLSRRLRRWVSGGLMVAVLFTQLAIAAWSCPESEPAHEEVAITSEMPDCHEIGAAAEPSQASLCKAHCGTESQSAARGPAPDLQPHPASLALLVRVIEPPPTALHTQALQREPPLARAPVPVRLYLSLHALRN